MEFIASSHFSHCALAPNPSQYYQSTHILDRIERIKVNFEGSENKECSFDFIKEYANNTLNVR